jgi:hypothetical protein
MKRPIVLALFTLFAFSLISTISISEVPYEYIIDGDTVYVDVAGLFYISQTPHTLTDFKNTPIITATSKFNTTKDFDFAFGFNTDSAIPKEALYYNPHQVVSRNCPQFNESRQQCQYTCTGDYFNYTTSPNFGQCWEDVLTNDTQEHDYYKLIFEHTFEQGDIGQKRMWWTEYKTELWTDISDKFDTISYDYNDKDTWYIIQNVSFDPNETKTLKPTIFVNANLAGNDGKYDLCIKPSELSISEAIAQGKFVCIDPWWNSTWTKKQALHIDYTTGTNSTLTDYAIWANITYDSDMNLDFSDLRFLDEDDSTVLDYFIEKPVNSSHAETWVEIPLMNNSENKTIYMYYGNPTAQTTSNCEDTFPFCDDFEDQDIYNMTVRTPSTWVGVGDDVFTDTEDPQVGNQHVVCYDTGTNIQWRYDGLPIVGDQFIWRSYMRLVNGTDSNNRLYWDKGSDRGLGEMYHDGSKLRVFEGAWRDLNFWTDYWSQEWVILELPINMTANVWSINVTFQNGTEQDLSPINEDFDPWVKGGLSHRENGTWSDNFAYGLNAYTNAYQQQDLTLIRPFVIDEPTYPDTISFGAEESAPVTIIDVSSCQALQTEGVTYRLTQNITADSEPCFDVNASDIIIDFNGYAVIEPDYNNTAIHPDGANISNVTVKDGIIEGFEYGIISNAVDMFNILTVSNMIFDNNTFGINLDDSDKDNIIITNSIFKNIGVTGNDFFDRSEGAIFIEKTNDNVNISFNDFEDAKMVFIGNNETEYHNNTHTGLTLVEAYGNHGEFYYNLFENTGMNYFGFNNRSFTINTGAVDCDTPEALDNKVYDNVFQNFERTKGASNYIMALNGCRNQIYNNLMKNSEHITPIISWAWFDNISYNTIENITLDGDIILWCDYTIIGKVCHNSTVSFNTIDGSQYGIVVLSNIYYPEIFNNTMTNVPDGIFIYSATPEAQDRNVTGARVFNNTGDGNFTILDQYVYDTWVCNNNFANFIDSGTNTTSCALPSIALTLNFSAINWASLSAGTNNNPSDEDYHLNVSLTGACTGFVDFATFNAFTTGSHEIGLGNFSMNYTQNSTSYPTLLSLDTNRTVSVNDGDSIYPEYFLSVPNNQYHGVYTTTHYIEGRCT